MQSRQRSIRALFQRVVVVVNVFLLRTHIVGPRDAIDPEARVDEYAAAAGLDFQCRFFLGPPNEHPPTWFDFVNPGLIRQLPRRVQAGVSGVVVLAAAGRFFAITFGRGRYLLAPGSYEEDFGLKVALNRIEENDLKTMDTKTYDEIVTSARIQASRDTGLESFGVDISRDILRAVEGRPKDKQFATRLAGADAVTISRSGLVFADLADLCDELLTAYGEIGYRLKFPWVDNVRQVRDVSTLTMLDAALVTAIQTGNLGTMHLALSDDERAIGIEAYRFTRSGDSVEFPTLELAAYIQHSLGRRLPDLSIETLRQHRIKVRYAGSADFEPHAPIYQSLVWETSITGEIYAFFDGRWFAVETGYSNQVQQYCQGLIRQAYPLPNANLGEKEADYNRRAAGAAAGLALFDLQRLRATNGRSPIELCDLLSDKGHFIHVKRRYASATFSHQFAQGSVSAETFMSDLGFRQSAIRLLRRLRKRNHIPLFPKDRPTARNYEIVYAVVAPASAAAHLLPFFSAVNLRQHGQRLETLGFRVALQHVIAQ